MTLKEAVDNLWTFYAGDEDNHDYIRESWKTLNNAASLKLPPCQECREPAEKDPLWNSMWVFCPWCGRQLQAQPRCYAQLSHTKGRFDMANLKRYDVGLSGTAFIGMCEAPNGPWVKFDGTADGMREREPDTQSTPCQDMRIKNLEAKVAALELAVEKFTSYINSRDAIFSEQQCRISQLEKLTSGLNLTHHVRG